MAPIDEGAARAPASGERRRALRWVAGVVLVWLALVATHRGEFWPFSVFPMFAGAGRPWVRALVHALPEPLAADALASEYELAALPGAPFALEAHGVPQHDVSSLVQRAERWTADETAALVSLFGDLPCHKPLLVLRVRGALDGDRVRARATPAALLTCAGGQSSVRPLLTGAEP